MCSQLHFDVAACGVGIGTGAMGGCNQFLRARLILLGDRYVKLDAQGEAFTLALVERADADLGAHLHDSGFFFANMA